MNTNQPLNSYLQQVTADRNAHETVIRTMNPYNAVHDLTEKDEARMTMYRLRSETAITRLERQRKAALKSDMQQVRDIILCYAIPLVLLVVGIIFLYRNFR